MGHHGFNDTCKKIEGYLRNNVIKADNGQRLTQPWPAMRDQVSVFLRKCSCCQIYIIFDVCVKKTWSDYYQLVERIINVQIHSVTKVSQAQIIYCNTTDLDRAILRQGDEPNPSRYME